MALWVNRTGEKGQHEDKFLSDKKIYLTWDNLSEDLSHLDKEKLLKALQNIHKDKKSGKLNDWKNQIFAWVNDMKVGDWVIVPSKKESTVHIGEITGGYTHVPNNHNPYYHYRDIKWIAQKVSVTTIAKSLKFPHTKAIYRISD